MQGNKELRYSGLLDSLQQLLQNLRTDDITLSERG